ncbi:cytochrome P450 27C1 isoform X1 [Scyliorhinus canicula]|uniref:cytochrome P450 27C1 isoform X1 n=1 Tax=Scyliorhinus canicula TaxID=7830 RepID=UPI0018F36704|nr:cytochrome P450 27C1 isoform X1 [Scyliorhinus canicula]
MPHFGILLNLSKGKACVPRVLQAALRPSSPGQAVPLRGTKGGVGTLVGQSSPPAAKPQRVRDLSEMPGPGTWSNLVEFFLKNGFSRIHDIQLQHTQQYGKIFKSHFGPQFVVSIADRDMVAQVLRAEGRAPQRANMESWQEYRQLRGRATGLISAEGEEWLKMRNVLKQRIMKPKDVAMFSEGVTDVIADLIKRMKCVKDQEGASETITDVNNLFFKFAMESVATILFETRLGCLEHQICQETKDYMEALELMFSMFKTTMYAGAIPKWLRPFIPKPWNEFCRSWDGLFRFSEIHIDRKMSQIQRQLEEEGEVQGGLLTCLLLNQEMTLEEVYANMTEMLLAGVDTTSFTLSWSTYLLARNPAVQRVVYEEIVRNLGSDVTPKAQDLSRLPSVRGVLKETLRLFPVLPGNGRVTQEDMIVGGYFIPSGTQLALCHYTTSHDREVFDQPGEFQPHRWLRKNDADRVDNFGAIPFGYGVRSCVGRRIAELEIHLALIQLLQAFEIKVAPNTGTVPAKTHGLLGPGKPINLKFVDRK